MSLRPTPILLTTVLLLLPCMVLAQTGKEPSRDQKPSAQVFDSETNKPPVVKAASEPGKVTITSTSGAKGVAAAHFEKEIAVWRDPLTLPHTRTECCRVEEIDSTGIKICTQYCTDCQWMYVHAWVIVDIDAPGDIEGSINDCHNQAAAAGLATGIVTAALGGGGAALEAAGKAYADYFSICLASKIQQKILNIRVDFRSGWGNWEGC